MSDLCDHAEYDGNVIRVDVSEIEYETIAIPATPNGELRELVEQWREKAREIDHEEYGYVCTGRKHPKAYQLQECADELEGLLDE